MKVKNITTKHLNQNNMTRKILKTLYIVQYKTIKVDNKYVKFHTKRRLNPFNPLTYLVMIIAIISGLLMFGFVGFWKEVDLINPFKWR